MDCEDYNKSLPLQIRQRQVHLTSVGFGPSQPSFVDTLKESNNSESHFGLSSSALCALKNQKVYLQVSKYYETKL
jgi:hypothetical protein